jgi:drug/metabolite transporter (DMT)-like permease
MAIAGMRSAIAGFVVVLMFLFLGRRPRFTFSPAQVLGGLTYSLTVILFVLANKLTTAANVILLQYTAPIYVALLASWFLGEKTTRWDWFVIATVIGGMLLFFLDTLEPGGFIGNILAIISGVTIGCFAIFMRMQKGESTIESLLIGNFVTALVCLPFMLQSMPDLKGWVGLTLLGVVQLGIPYILYAIAVKDVTALDSMLIPIIEPLLNPLWVFFLLGERPGPWALVGGAIVLISVTLRGVKIARMGPEKKPVVPEIPVVGSVSTEEK